MSGMFFNIIILMVIQTVFSRYTKDDPREGDKYTDNDPNRFVVDIEGVVDHGINTFNDEKIFKNTDTIANIFGIIPPLTFIATLPVDYDEFTISEFVSETTNRDNLLSTIPEFPSIPGFPFEPPPIPDEYFSIPVTSIGVLDSISQDIADRLPVKSYEDVPNIDEFQQNRRSKFANNNPTLRDFEQITGILHIKCNSYLNHYRLEFEIKNGLPKMVYTIWETRIYRPFQANERLDGVAPVLPNIFITDKNGNGKINFELPYCPYDSCVPKDKCPDGGCPDCVPLYSLSTHWDYSAYGGTSALESTDPALPPGTITNGQMAFWVSSILEQ